MLRRARLVLSAWLCSSGAVGCRPEPVVAAPPPPAQSAAATGASASVAPAPAQTTETAVDPAPAASPSVAVADAGTAPPSVTGKPDASTGCDAETVRRQLEGAVAACRSRAARLCGKVVLSASADAGAVDVDFDLRSPDTTRAFAQCVAERAADIDWHCTAGGAKVVLDLGCDL